MTLNDCKLAGFIGSAPELRFLPSGVPVTNMRVGQSYVYTDAKQQPHRKTNWFSDLIDCEMFWFTWNPSRITNRSKRVPLVWLDD